MAPVTVRNLDYLRALQEFQDTSGFTPTVRELGTQLGVASPATVHQHLVRLRAAGLLESRGARWRVTDRGRDVLGVMAR